ncbi:hypothetical protein [Dokdonia sp. Asnod3-C12]|uniref:hypothetical protein n=1 Tax=Dokdonia sp. Asnod3-C12 TaxID=3160575 RepID=UPI00386E5B85
MRNIFLTAAVIILSVTSGLAQKIKVKKDFVEADKVQVAKIEKLGASYTFTSLDDDAEKFIVDHKGLKISEDLSKEWLIIKNADESKRTEVDMEYLSFTMNLKKGIAELLFKKYKLLSTDGVEIETLNSFLDVDRPNLTNQYNDLLKGQIAEEKAKKNALASINVTVGDDQKIREGYKGPDDSNVIGYYTDEREASTTTFSVYDLDNHKVAIASITAFGSKSNNVEVNLPYEKTTFSYVAQSSNRNNNGSYSTRFVQELAKQLGVNGVTLGHQVEEKRENAQIARGEQLKAARVEAVEAYEVAKEASNNIYGASGYIISEKGERVEGDISVKWTDIPAPGDWDNVVAIGGEDTGKKVSVRYKNKKGKTRYKTFSSKNEERFCLTVDGEESCYIGAKLKGKGLELAAGAMSSLSFDTSEYYKIIKEDDNILILQDVDNNAYSVKVKKEKKGFQFNISNADKNLEGMNKYFGEDLEALKDLDYRELSSAEAVVDFYNQNIKK